MFLGKSQRFAGRLFIGSVSVLATGGVAMGTLTATAHDLPFHPLYSIGLGTVFSTAVSSVVLGVGYRLLREVERNRDAIAELAVKVDGEKPTVPLRIVGTATVAAPPQIQTPVAAVVELPSQKTVDAMRRLARKVTED